MRVIHIKDKSKYSNTEYIGRGSVFGNPYHVQKHGRNTCIEKYRQYFYERLERDVKFKEAVHSLKIKDRNKELCLVCYCKPLDCHGDIIKEYCDNL